MSPRNPAIALGLVIVAVVLQTTLFGGGRLQPLGAAPNLVLLVVVGAVRYLDAEPALLVGFTAGLLVDLLGGSPLGLWAMVLTVIAYVTLRVRDRADDGVAVIGVGVFALTFVGAVLFMVVSTLFGQRTLADPQVWDRMLLPSIYNVVLAVGVLPGISLAMKTHTRTPRWVA